MIKKLQKKYALSKQGAKDLIKGCLACVLQNLDYSGPPAHPGRSSAQPDRTSAHLM